MKKEDKKWIGTKRKLRKAPFLGLILSVLAIAGLFWYQNKEQSFTETAMEHPVVKDTRTAKEAQKDFDALMMEIFKDEVTDNTINLNYTVKDRKKYGLEKVEVSLGDISLKGLKDSLFVSENRVATLETFDYNKLTKRQQLEYDLVYKLSKQNLESADFLNYTEPLGPTSGTQAQLPVFLSEYHLNSKSDVGEYIQILNLIPAYFEQIISLEEKKAKDGIFMSDTTAQAIIEQCKSFVENPEKNYLLAVFDNKISKVTGMPKKEKEEWKDKNREGILKKVIPAYQKLIDALTRLKGSGKNENGLCHLKKGKAYYTYLVKSLTGSDRSLKNINEMLDDKIDVLRKNLAVMMADSPQAYYDAQNISYPYNTPQKAIEHLKKEITKHFPALPSGIDCDIKYVDKSLEEKMSPAFYLAPCIDAYKENVIYVNRNKKYDLSKAFTTIAHEGYPGHLYQSCYFNSTNPDPVRSVISVSGYSEGWGTYAELYSYDLAGIDKKVAMLLKENTLATLCIYAKADLAVNYLGWDYDKLHNYLTDYGFNKVSSRVIFDSVVAEPVGYLKYTLGYLEIKELQKTAKQMLGKSYNEKEFHEFFLSMGPVTFDIARQQMLLWIQEIEEKK